MASFQIRYYSNCLRRCVSFLAYLPNDPRGDVPPMEEKYADRGMKTLFLLHGYTGDA